MFRHLMRKRLARDEGSPAALDDRIAAAVLLTRMGDSSLVRERPDAGDGLVRRKRVLFLSS